MTSKLDDDLNLLANDRSPAAARWMWAILAIHFALLAISLPDYRVSIDSGYHVSLGRWYGEHGTAFWDHINYGPGGRPNLQGPLMHVAIGVVGRIFGGSGDAYVVANAILSLLQWCSAVLTVVFFARKFGGDRTALVATALATGSAAASISYAVGLPSGLLFIFTAWAIWFFSRDRWIIAALLVSAAIYSHLGGYATAPLGVFVVAVLLRKWKHLFLTGLLSVVLTLPYTIQLLRYRDWYIGERGHVAAFGSPLIYILAIAGLALVLMRPRRNAVVIAWAVAPIAWLFQDSSRFWMQSSLAGGVLGGMFVVWVAMRYAPRWKTAIPVCIALVATIFPLTVPSLLPEAMWAIGNRYPRMMEWSESKRLAEVIRAKGLQHRLVYAYNHSFAPSLAVYEPLQVELGHWVEVQPRPDPARELSAGVKVYVLPVAPGDEVLRMLEREGLVVVHGGTEKSAVLTLTRPGELRHVAKIVGDVAAREAAWLGEHAVRNAIEPVDEVLSSRGLAERRARLREQRIHAGRLSVAALVYAYALEPQHPEEARGSRSSVRGFASMSAFLSDEWAADFIDETRHERMKENFKRFSKAVSKLAETILSNQELDDASDHLFDEFFWAA